MLSDMTLHVDFKFSSRWQCWVDFSTCGKQSNNEEEMVSWFKFVSEILHFPPLYLYQKQKIFTLTQRIIIRYDSISSCGCLLTTWKVCTAEPVWMILNPSSSSRKRWASVLFCLCRWMLMLLDYHLQKLLSAWHASVTMTETRFV